MSRDARPPPCKYCRRMSRRPGTQEGRRKAGAESMPVRETLQTILTDYPAGKEQPFAGHISASFIRQSAPEAVKAALGELGAGLLLEGSAGAGNWVTVPWISVFDPAITTTVTHGRRDAESPTKSGCARNLRCRGHARAGSAQRPDRCWS